MTSQLIIGLIVAAIFFLAGSNLQVLSAAYGSMVTILVSAYLGYGVFKAEKIAQTDPKKSLGILYFGAAQRFILVAGLFIVGLAILKLEPLATATGFGFAQLGYVINLRQQSRIN
ncbi:MAG: ATP synthase subunit I [Gammaproteobacteria bacterium]|nr:ATP synthase subunit I [Gammaproteobacteria bacterium]